MGYHVSVKYWTLCSVIYTVLYIDTEYSAVCFLHRGLETGTSTLPPESSTSDGTEYSTSLLEILWDGVSTDGIRYDTVLVQ